MTKEYLEEILTEYGVAFTDSLADRLLKEFEPCEDNSINPELNGDMISRQAVLDVVFESRKNFNNEFDQGFFADKIRDLPPVTPQPKTGHWIPVSERLPEFRKEVLTCSNGGFIEIQSLEDSCADIYWENQKGDWSDFDEIIAWMPLPSPYEPQERSEKK